MRLLNLKHDGGLSLKEFAASNIPPYAILSHTWGPGEEEVTFKDIINGSGEEKLGYTKIRFCAEQAARDGLHYFWIDTCCIDKTNSVELSEAINSMFRWYHDAAICYVYLSDVLVSGLSINETSSEITWEESFMKARWFERGWTLQELIAPISLEFFSRNGERLGDKKSLELQIHEITGIPIQCLRGESLSSFSVSERMKWTTGRVTMMEEDSAYCLLGIFNIYMPLIYGEGRKHAFRRLHEELKKSLKWQDMRIESDHISSNIGTTTLDHFGTQESSKSMEVNTSKDSKDAKSWSASSNTKISLEQWEQIKGLCARLYVHENRNLNEERKAQFQRKMKEWGFRKNLKSVEWGLISRTIESRKRLGKSTAVHLRGTLIPEKKLRKELSRVTYNSSYPESDYVLPDDVVVTTPPPSQSSPKFTATEFHDIPWFEFQDALAEIVKSASINETDEPLFVSCEFDSTSSVDIRNVTQSILATSIPSETSDTTNLTLQSIYSYIRALVPERHPREILSAVEKIFSSSTGEVLYGCLNIIVLLCSNNFISDQQTYHMASLAYARGAKSLLMSILSISTPTATVFATYLFRGALKAEDLQIVRLMIHGPLHLDPRLMLPKRGNAPLKLAVARGNIDLAKILLEAGADPNDYMQSEHEWWGLSRETTTQRDLKSNENRIEGMKINLARTTRKDHTNVNPNHFDSLEGSSEDHASTVTLDTPLVTSRLEDLKDSSIESAKAKAAITVLQIAVEQQSLDIIKLLIEAGADVNTAPAMHSGMTALQAASRSGNLEVVTLLLEAGADINAALAMHSGMTALQAASRSGNLEVVTLLLEAGADINAAPAIHSGMTALQAASRSGNLEVVTLLLGAGADLRSSAETYPRETALQIAIKNGNFGLVEILLEATAQDYSPLEPRYGGILLCIAASSGYVGIVRFLLDNAISHEANIILPYLETAIESAAERGRLDMVYLLCNSYKGISGARVQFKTARALAMQNGHYALAEMLTIDDMEEC